MTEERISEVEDVSKNEKATGKTMGKERNSMANTCEIITKSVKYA